jgi:ribosomal protein L12E/L44/L45/RPP1/RPP2
VVADLQSVEELLMPRVRTGPQCSAKRTNGLPCKNAPIRGGATCYRHGGAAPQVREKANQRLLEIVMPSLARLRKIVLDPTTSDTDALRAIREVLNRTGFTERFALEVAPNDKWMELVNSAVELVDDRSMGELTDDRSDMAALASAGEQLAYDATQQNFREQDTEEAEAYEAGRIRPDENTVRGQVVDGPHPIYPPERQPHPGPSEFDATPQGPYAPSGPTRIQQIQARLIEQAEEEQRRGRD